MKKKLNQIKQVLSSTVKSRSIRGGAIFFMLNLMLSLGVQADPLFDQLEGEWQGTGYKTELVTNHTVKLQVTKNFWTEGNRLRIRTQTLEVPLDGFDGEPRERVSFHWLRMKDQKNENGQLQYDYGYGSGDYSAPFATATLVGDTIKIVDGASEGDPWVSISNYEIQGQKMHFSATLASEREKIRRIDVDFSKK